LGFVLCVAIRVLGGRCSSWVLDQMPSYASCEYTLAAAQLVLATLGMGVRLRPRDFVQVLRAPKALFLVLGAQLVLAPLVALALAKCLPLPQGFVGGMILMTAMPVGAMANIFIHLGRGNAPLAISATALSALTSLATIPLVLHTYGPAQFPADFSMPIGRIVAEVCGFMLLPLALAMIAGRWAPEPARRLAPWCIRGSLAVLATVVIGSLTSGRLPVLAYGWLPPLVLVAFGGVTLGACYALGSLCRLRLADSFTVAVLVTIRNGNLALLLKAALFPALPDVVDAVAGGVLYVVLFYSGVSLVISAAAAGTRWGRPRSSGGVLMSRHENQPALSVPS
jgi:BASS family bile acid:Na+ symporter